jgi:hypothetical protein
MRRSPFLAVVCFLTSTCFSSVIHIPADQPTIQAGINAAHNGDTVLVSPGTYTENINFNGKAIAVVSSNGPKSTVINGNHAGPCATFISGESPKSVLRGFTLTDGVGAGAPYYTQGGGVAIAYSSPTITGNVIVGNSDGNGGGIGSSFGSPVITYNTIKNNKASLGAGIFIGGASSPGAVVRSNTIESNSTYDYYSGGGIALWAAGSAVLEDNLIAYNSARYGQGGGMYVVNEADEAIVQNLIFGNTAGSGSQVYTGVPQSATGFRLVNNTIVSTVSGADTAVMADGFNQNAIIANNIIVAAGNEVGLLCNPVYKYGPPVVEYNDVISPHGVDYGDSCSGFEGTNGNISADPQFTGTSNFRLKDGSLAIDAGDHAAPDLPATDFAGNPRIVNGNGGSIAIVDMGAYEFIPVTLTPKTLNFGVQAVGSTSTKTVTLTNALNKSLNIASKTVPTGYKVSGCGTSVAAFGSCSLTVTFHPLTTGSFKGEMTVKDNAGNSPEAVSLSGTAD